MEDIWLQTVSFGDRPAAALLEIAIRMTAKSNKSIVPLAAQRICDDCYVDDFATGGSQAEVAPFKGNELANYQFDAIVPTILAKRSLTLLRLGWGKMTCDTT